MAGGSGVRQGISTVGAHSLFVDETTVEIGLTIVADPIAKRSFCERGGHHHGRKSKDEYRSHGCLLDAADRGRRELRPEVCSQRSAVIQKSGGCRGPLYEESSACQPEIIQAAAVPS
jgi:hypothetical protein